MKFNAKKITICVVALAAVAGGAWFFMHKQDAPFEVSYETAKMWVHRCRVLSIKFMWIITVL